MEKKKVSHFDSENKSIRTCTLHKDLLVKIIDFSHILMKL